MINDSILAVLLHSAPSSSTNAPNCKQRVIWIPYRPIPDSEMLYRSGDSIFVQGAFNFHPDQMFSGHHGLLEVASGQALLRRDVRAGVVVSRVDPPFLVAVGQDDVLPVSCFCHQFSNIPRV